VSVERRAEQAALERAISEMRAEPSPALDWERIEARLMRESKPQARSNAARFLSRLRVPVIALGAAAAAAFAVSSHHSSTPVAAHAPVAKLVNGPLNGDQLALGTRITAGSQNVVVEHQGRARWTLEPHSTAFVSNAGVFLTVQLESGALSAAVVPNTKPETFAVEAGGTRVAVHGTAFRVERTADRVLVQVSEGTVAVEPTQTHSDPSFLLRRDSRGNFGLDGRSGTVEGNASVVVRKAGPESHREIGAHSSTQPAAPHSAPSPPHVTSGTPPATPEPENAATASAQAQPQAQTQTQTLPIQPSISDIENGVSSAVNLLTGCFRNQTTSAGNRVSATTGMTLSVSSEGAVQSVTFRPPLEPPVEDCAVIGLRQLTFAKSTEGVTFTRVIELTR
jgi:ferric-dicitrate binding protein FerR (iron transport regulator)